MCKYCDRTELGEFKNNMMNSGKVQIFDCKAEATLFIWEDGRAEISIAPKKGDRSNRFDMGIKLDKKFKYCPHCGRKLTE